MVCRTFVIALALLAAACQPQPPPQVVQVGGALELQLPSGWEIEPTSAGALLARPTEDGQRIPGAYFLVSLDKARDAARPAELASYVKFKEMQAPAGAMEYFLVDRRELRLDGSSAELRLREWSHRNEQRRAVHFMVVRSGTGYSLVGSALTRDFPRLKADFAAVAESLRWLKEPE